MEKHEQFKSHFNWIIIIIIVIGKSLIKNTVIFMAINFISISITLN